MMPESPSSPETHTQGLDVVIALLSFLMGMMTTRYGITAKKTKKASQFHSQLLICSSMNKVTDIFTVRLQ